MKTLDRTQTPETFAMLADSPVQFVELWERTFPKDDDAIAAAREAMEEAGVQARTVHVGFGQGYDISHQDETSRNAGMELSAMALDLAVKTGGEIIVVHPSAEPLEEHERGERTELARQSITILEDLAGEVGCRVAIELIPRTNLGRTVEEIFELIDHADPDVVGVKGISCHLMKQYTSLRGLEEAMLDMYTEPNMIHDAMAFFTEGHKRIPALASRDWERTTDAHR